MSHSLQTEVQAPLSMEFSRQEYSSGLTFPSAGDRDVDIVNIDII